MEGWAGRVVPVRTFRVLSLERRSKAKSQQLRAPDHETGQSSHTVDPGALERPFQVALVSFVLYTPTCS